VRRGILILFVCLLFACGEGSDDDSPLPCEHTATLIGDSLTALPGWAQLIQDEFLPGEIRIAAGLGFTMRTMEPGKFWYDREEFDKFPPCTLVILLGSNDAGRFRQTPASSVLGFLNKIIDQTLDDGAERILVMTPPPVFNPDLIAIGTMDRLLEYHDGITERCERDPDDLVECGPDLFLEMEEIHFTTDGVHFSVLGGEWLFVRLLPFLK
jgi:lysophospholipase L1-like esterase